MEEENEPRENADTNQEAPPAPGFEGFEKIFTDLHRSEGTIWRHHLVKETVDDYIEVYEIATDFARRGCTVKILPVLDVDHPLRETVFAGAKENKCPDLCVDGEYIDVKTPLGDPSINTIDNNVRKGHRQANYVIVRISGEISYWELKWVAEKRFARHETLHTIVFKVIGKTTHTFTRP